MRYNGAMPNTDPNAGTAPEGEEAQSEQPEAAATTGTPTTPDEVTTLRSRNAGLDAKVTELSKAQKAAEQARDEALARLSDYESGKAGENEALAAQLAEKDRLLEAAKREALVAKLEGQFPETYALFGEAIAGMTPDVLAASEARLKGAGFESDNPTPVGNSPARAQAPANKSIEDMTVAELEKHLKGFDKSVMGL